MNNGTDTDILIAGAGPVGLLLANECARRGLRYRIVEKRATQSVHSKALAIFPRTLEIFDMAGLVDPFLAVANRVTSAAIIVRGRRIAQMPFTPEASPYPFIAMVPQDVTEKILVEALESTDGAVDYETTFVSAQQHKGHVRVTLEHGGREQEITASYVVGCDGAHSRVRHMLDLPFEGGEYHASFLLADVDTNEALASDEFQLCPSTSGPLAIFPMGPTRRRIVATVYDTEGDAPSIELVRRILGERGPGELHAYSMHWSSYFHIHHRLTPSLRRGRIFIAGDAAHVHSPFGGQGMNTGLHDVWNLIWKLDFALNGKSDGELLDSYTAERLPVIRSVVEMTDFLTRAMGTPSKLAEALRDTMIPLASRLAPVQHAIVRRLSELGVAYKGSPIVEGAGERYFDDSLRGGNGIKSRFILLLPEAADPSTKVAARQLAVACDEVLELRATRGSSVMLLRPDGYLAYLAPSGAHGKAITAMRSLLQRQSAAAA